MRNGVFSCSRICLDAHSTHTHCARMHAHIRVQGVGLRASGFGFSVSGLAPLALEPLILLAQQLNQAIFVVLPLSHPLPRTPLVQQPFAMDATSACPAAACRD